MEKHISGKPAAPGRKDRAGGQRRASAAAFVVQGLGTGLLLLAQLGLARILKVEQFGIYIYSVSWVRLLALVSRIGLERSSPRHVAAYAALGQWGALRGFVTRSHQIVVLTSLGCAALMLGVVWLLRDMLEGDLWSCFLAGAALLPMMALLQLQTATLRGLRQIQTSLAIRLIVPPLVLLGLLAVAMVSQSSLRSVDAMFFQATSFGVAIIFASFLLWKVAPAEMRSSTPVFETREWVATALPMLFMTGFHMLLKNTDTIMVGSMVGRSEAGIYAAASRMALLLALAINSINATIAPKVAALYAEKRLERLQEVVQTATRHIAVLILPLTIGGVGGERICAVSVRSRVHSRNRRIPGASHRAVVQRAGRIRRARDDHDGASEGSDGGRGRRRGAEPGARPRADTTLWHAGRGVGNYNLDDRMESGSRLLDQKEGRNQYTPAMVNHTELPPLLILGGQQKKFAHGLAEWQRHERATMLRIDPADDSSRVLLEYQSPPEVCADEEPAFLFRAGTIYEDRLYVPTLTEVLVYSLPGLEQVGYLSLAVVQRHTPRQAARSRSHAGGLHGAGHGHRGESRWKRPERVERHRRRSVGARLPLDRLSQDRQYPASSIPSELHVPSARRGLGYPLRAARRHLFDETESAHRYRRRETP